VTFKAQGFKSRDMTGKVKNTKPNGRAQALVVQQRFAAARLLQASAQANALRALRTPTPIARGPIRPGGRVLVGPPGRGLVGRPGVLGRPLPAPLLPQRPGLPLPFPGRLPVGSVRGVVPPPLTARLQSEERALIMERAALEQKKQQIEAQKRQLAVQQQQIEMGKLVAAAELVKRSQQQAFEQQRLRQQQLARAQIEAQKQQLLQQQAQLELQKQRLAAEQLSAQQQAVYQWAKQQQQEQVFLEQQKMMIQNQGVAPPSYDNTDYYTQNGAAQWGTTQASLVGNPYASVAQQDNKLWGR